MSNYSNKFSRFLRNNVALLLIIFCILAITTVVLVVTLSEEAPPIDDPVNNDPDPTDPTDNEPEPEPVYETVKIYFETPVSYTGVGMGYTDGVDVLFVYNSTIGVWKTHKGIDYLAADGADVVSMYDGTVITTGSTYGDGNYVVIDHGNGVVATYASLNDISVVNGQVLEKGERIGAASTTASYSFKEGPHVHIEVKVNGVSVDPTPYVEGEIYREVQRLVED